MRSLAKDVRQIIQQQPTKPRPGKASRYLHHLPKYYQKYPNMVAVLTNRLSKREQARRQNHRMYAKKLHKACRKRNIPVGRWHPEVSSGWILNQKREGLINAVKEAKELIKKGFHPVILAASTDRFLRNRNWTTNQPDLLPTVEEFEKLKELVEGVPLVTLLHPDKKPSKVTSFRSRWGQEAKGNKGGRPKKNKPGYKKRWRKKTLRLVQKLRGKGYSLSEISHRAITPKSTVHYWLQK